jgi:glutathione S-transferase
MSLKFYGHPFSSYCQKALIALYENDIPFEWRVLSPDHPENGAAFAALWPIAKFPVLVDGGRPVMEATTIIEYLAVHRPGPVRLIPEDGDAAVQVRMMDRISPPRGGARPARRRRCQEDAGDELSLAGWCTEGP